MKNILAKTFLAISMVFAMGTSVYAVGDLIPEPLLKLFKMLGPNSVCGVDYVVSRVQVVLYLVLGGLVLLSIIYAIAAAYKYIRSAGDPGEMEKAQKSIKAIFYGIAALILTILGIVVIYAVLGAEPTNPQLFQTCLSAPDSKGCEACQESINNPICSKCEQQYKLACAKYRETGDDDAALMEIIDKDCQPVFQVN